LQLLLQFGQLAGEPVLLLDRKLFFFQQQPPDGVHLLADRRLPTDHPCRVHLQLGAPQAGQGADAPDLDLHRPVHRPGRTAVEP